MLEPIRRRSFHEPDRAEVQEIVARAVERDPDFFIEQYCSLEQSFKGRYVNADLFKETFDLYRASNETRNRYNTVVHNASAVLASEQLRRVLTEPVEPDREAVVLLTGVPGAGKTSAILGHGGLPRHTHAVYEGQMATRQVALAKVQQVLDAGLQPVIVAVHVRPERALENTLQRFHEVGRGASIEAMASIQGGLPMGLAAVRDRFGDAVELRILDRREFAEPKEWKGWEALAVLESEGRYEQIKQCLTHHLQGQRERLPEDAWRQAVGLAPILLPDQRARAGPDRQHEGAGEGREAAQEGRQETLLIPSSAPVMTAAERLRLRADEVAERLAAERAQERSAREALEPRMPSPACEQQQDQEQQRERDPDDDRGLER